VHDDLPTMDDDDVRRVSQPCTRLMTNGRHSLPATRC
jgi:geranylgeranyl pyrophosphate synthase